VCVCVWCGVNRKRKYKCKSKETHILFSIAFCRKSGRLWDNVVKYVIAGQATDDVRRMCIACWLPKTTNKPSECLILFHCNNGCTNAPRCYDLRTLSVLSATHLSFWSYAHYRLKRTILMVFLLGAFAKLRKQLLAPSCLCVCPSVSPHGKTALPLNAVKFISGFQCAFLQSLLLPD